MSEKTLEQQEAEAPPLYPKVSPEEFDKMSDDEQEEYSFQLAKAAIARYGGRPELMLKENPHLDLENPPRGKSRL